MLVSPPQLEKELQSKLTTTIMSVKHPCGVTDERTHVYPLCGLCLFQTLRLYSADMFEDAAAEATEAAASIFDSDDDDGEDKSDDDDDDDASFLSPTEEQRRRVKEREAATAARESWNQGRVSLSFAPRHSHRPPGLPRTLCPETTSQQHVSSSLSSEEPPPPPPPPSAPLAAAAGRRYSRLGRWLFAVEGSQLYAACEEGEWYAALASSDGGGGAEIGADSGDVNCIPESGTRSRHQDPSPSSYPSPEAFLRLKSAAVCRVGPGDALFLPAGYVVASVALTHSVVATRRVVTVGSYAATDQPRSCLAGGSSSDADVDFDLDFKASAALRAHAKSCRGGRLRALMTAPTCGVSPARWEKYAEAVELLWACN